MMRMLALWVSTCAFGFAAIGYVTGYYQNRPGGIMGWAANQRSYLTSSASEQFSSFAPTLLSEAIRPAVASL